MEYLTFVVLFTLIHAFDYTVAGATALRISPDMYREKGQVLDYLRDMTDDTESVHVTKWFLPAQLVRGVLMAIVLLPIAGLLGDISFLARSGTHGISSKRPFVHGAYRLYRRMN